MSSKQPSKEKAPKTKRKLSFVSRRSLPWLISIFLLLIAGFLFLQYRQAQDKLSGSKNENAKIEKKLGEIILLPAEKPSIFTVSNSANAKKQSAFYKNAQNGDRVFVYAKEKKAILYRPSTNMIINVQPINATPSQ
jgi:hypothetical protein